MIIGLSSNSGGESFTFECRRSQNTDTVVTLTLVASLWSGDHDLASTITTVELPLSTVGLSQLRIAIETWLETDVNNAALLNGNHHLAGSEDFVFDLSFGRRDDLIASVDKPTVTIQYKLGKLNSEFKFVTDQSCLRDFVQGLLQLATSIAE